jgi:cardiolipin synthase
LLELFGLSRWVATAIFMLAMISDYADGVLARAHGRQSPFGRIMDPVADKVLVCACLFLLAAEGSLSGWLLVPAFVIVLRELLVSGLRAALAGEGLELPVLIQAKVKTALQMTALFMLFVTRAIGSENLELWLISGILLWSAAVLSITTAYRYLLMMRGEKK